MLMQRFGKSTSNTMAWFTIHHYTPISVRGGRLIRYYTTISVTDALFTSYYTRISVRGDLFISYYTRISVRGDLLISAYTRISVRYDLLISYNPTLYKDYILSLFSYYPFNLVFLYNPVSELFIWFLYFWYGLGINRYY